jgi:hypothetical protein
LRYYHAAVSSGRLTQALGATYKLALNHNDRLVRRPFLNLLGFLLVGNFLGWR